MTPLRSLIFALACLVSLRGVAHAQAAEPLFRAVDAYAAYQDDISALIDADITTNDAIEFAVERAARHDSARLTRGWVAYGALTAAQSPAFVAGVRSRVRAASRAAVLRQLRRDVTYARRRPPGANEAIQLILNANAADAERINAAADRFDAIGHQLDASTWGRGAQDGDERTVRLRSLHESALDADEISRVHLAPLAAQPLTSVDAFGGRRFWDALAGRTSAAPPASMLRATNTALVDRMLTLAAFFVVGAGDDPAVGDLMDDTATRDCLSLQLLQFRQCASVSHDPNEDAFCISRHGLAAPAQCFARLVQ